MLHSSHHMNKYIHCLSSNIHHLEQNSKLLKDVICVACLHECGAHSLLITPLHVHALHAD